MVINWYNEVLAQEHSKDLLREAERYRLVRQALAGRARRDRFHCRALTWLGRRLVAWGWRLQEHYDGILVEAPALQVASHCQCSQPSA